MKMLVPKATILVDEDARSSSTLAFVSDDEVFLVFFFVEKKSKVVIWRKKELSVF